MKGVGFITGRVPYAHDSVLVMMLRLSESITRNRKPGYDRENAWLVIQLVHEEFALRNHGLVPWVYFVAVG